MQADPWWSFAMAGNVFLVFFCNANPESFRRYLWAYCLVCFGGPLVSAIVLISIVGDPRGPVFGDATVIFIILVQVGSFTDECASCGAG